MVMDVEDSFSSTEDSLQRNDALPLQNRFDFIMITNRFEYDYIEIILKSFV